MKKIILTPFLFISLFLCNQISNAQCHLDDWEALKALYESTNGNNWLNNSGWDVMIANAYDPPTNCNLDTLFGISLNDTGRVNAVFLLANNLQGNIPNEIGKLSELDELLLNYNSLTGVIPPEIGQLNNLTTLVLDFNQLSDSIPSEIGSLTNLVDLHLSENNLVGQIPSSIGYLSKLENLTLHENQLTGKIPSAIGNLDNLSLLILAYNQLSGCYANELTQLCNQIPSEFIFSPPTPIDPISQHNNFDATWEDFCATGNGACPPPPSNCRQTDSLALITIYQSLKPNHTWDLTKPLNQWPGVQIINENSCVDKLDLSEHGLWGVIPSAIGDLSEITFLRMAENSITGFLPSEIGNLTTLKVLSLSDNNIAGSVPKTLSKLTNLESLYLTQNQFTELPSDIGNFSNLVNLYLFQNQLNGCYPTEFAQLCNQLVSNSNTNFAISSGNNFNASWEDFCQTNSGACLQSPSTVSTNYSGNVNITVTSNENGEYVLSNNDVKVVDYTTCVLTDAENCQEDAENCQIDIENCQTDIENCQPVTGFDNLAANEVLWATEKAVQYFEDVFNISLPQVSSLVNSNYNCRPNSSTYSSDKNVIYYGIGDGMERTSMTAPDVVGHEFMHFVIKNLNDQFCRTGECGALNESYADIFGEVLEYVCRGSNDWIYGSKVVIAANSGIRNLSNPKDTTMQYKLPDPDTYLRDFWVRTCTTDLCGIHTNNGVHNYWFYLLANGGAGTNDYEFDYNVQGIGIEKAAQITFINLINNLTPVNTYTDVMYSSINVAKELYGENSTEVQQAIAAWEAVGLKVLQFNPINWIITDFDIVGPEVEGIPVQFDLTIDSLGQDINADGLNFTLHLPENYLFKINHIYPPLTIAEVDTTTNNGELMVRINRQNAGVQKRRSIAQKIKSGEPILQIGGNVVSLDLDGDCGSFPPIDISGGTEVIENQTINFNSSTLPLGSDCNPNQALKRQNFRVTDDLLNVALQLVHQSCINLGALKVEILHNQENSIMPYHYYLFDQNGEEIRNELESFNLKHQFYNLEEGIYQLRVQDSDNRNFIKNFEVKFSTEMNGSACCPENLTIPPGEFKGVFNASNRISIKSGTSINIGQLDTCD